MHISVEGCTKILKSAQTIKLVIDITAVSKRDNSDQS